MFQGETNPLKLDGRILIEKWRIDCNHIRPHSSLGYRPPAPEAIIPVTQTQRVVSFMGQVAQTAEVILVDGHSQDRTLEVTKKLRPDILVSTQPGKGEGDAELNATETTGIRRP